MPILRSRINLVSLALACALLAPAAGASPAFAASPSVAELDANARAAGNRLDIATQIGDRVFASALPAQVSQISANEFGGHLVLGIRMWGVKFHKPIRQREFVDQVAWLVRTAFAIAPSAQEVERMDQRPDRCDARHCRQWRLGSPDLASRVHVIRPARGERRRDDNAPRRR